MLNKFHEVVRRIYDNLYDKLKTLNSLKDILLGSMYKIFETYEVSKIEKIEKSK